MPVKMKKELGGGPQMACLLRRPMYSIVFRKPLLMSFDSTDGAEDPEASDRPESMRGASRRDNADEERKARRRRREQAILLSVRAL